MGKHSKWGGWKTERLLRGRGSRRSLSVSECVCVRTASPHGETEGREHGGEGGERHVDDDAPLVFGFLCHDSVCVFKGLYIEFVRGAVFQPGGYSGSPEPPPSSPPVGGVCELPPPPATAPEVLAVMSTVTLPSSSTRNMPLEYIMPRRVANFD